MAKLWQSQHHVTTSNAIRNWTTYSCVAVQLSRQRARFQFVRTGTHHGRFWSQLAGSRARASSGRLWAHGHVRPGAKSGQVRVGHLRTSSWWLWRRAANFEGSERHFIDVDNLSQCGKQVLLWKHGFHDPPVAPFRFVLFYQLQFSSHLLFVFLPSSGVFLELK